eukprot:5109316-Alexandrium_andersonii.AAC.1
MSASLVGSEMCIRDRGSPGGPPGRGKRGRGGPPCPGPRHMAATGAPPPACLLYTSDAADDM